MSLRPIAPTSPPTHPRIHARRVSRNQRIADNLWAITCHAFFIPCAGYALYQFFNIVFAL